MNAPAAHRTESNPRAADRLPLVGLLLVQLLIGYEWFVSGLTKIVRGGFPGGLAKELTEKSEGAPGWYRSFLDGSIIPNASAFGYLIEIGELVVGLALVAAALVWLTRWERLPDSGRVAVLATTVLASLGAIFMAVKLPPRQRRPTPVADPEERLRRGRRPRQPAASAAARPDRRQRRALARAAPHAADNDGGQTCPCTRKERDMTASTLFFVLLVLACPLMMMLMMRGGHGHGGHVHGHTGDGGHDHRDSPTERKSAAELRNQRDELDRLIEEREAEEKTPTTSGGGWQ